MGRWHFRDRRRVFRERPVRSGLRRPGLNPPFETDPGPGASQSDSYGRQLRLPATANGRAAPPTARTPFRLARIVAGCPRIPVRRFHRLSRYPRPAAFRLPVDGKRCRTHGLPRPGICRGAAGAGTERAGAAIRFVPCPPDAHPAPTRRPPGLGIRDESHASRSAGRGAIAPAIRTVRYGTRTKSEPPPVGSGAARLRAGTPIH